MTSLAQRSAYAAFKQRITAKALARRIPINCTFEVTHRCNLRCRHCYIPLSERGLARKRAPELTPNEFRHIIDQITAAGCLWIKLTGGEPFIRPDFMALYDYARSKGMLVTLYTNATRITPAVVDHLRVDPPENIEVSLYGSNERVYEDLTQTRGSFARCRQGIERLLGGGLPVVLKTPVTQTNIDDVPGLRAFARGLGVDIMLSGDITPRLNGDKMPLDMSISPDSSADLSIDFIDHLLPTGDELSQYLPETMQDSMFNCGAGSDSFHVSADGSLHLCLLYNTPGFNLKDRSFDEGWSGFLNGIRDRRFPPGNECLNCSDRSVCHNCPAKSLLVNGDDQSPVEYYCLKGERLANNYLRPAYEAETSMTGKSQTPRRV